MDEKPLFPLKVVWPNGEVGLFDDEVDVEQNLEWFDSEVSDHEGTPLVYDRLERRVRLKVEKLEVVWCELFDNPAD